tara:strand:+ start:35 stop:556 length:522 start_codon:yes stop_codon:yes gene_type:complete
MALKIKIKISGKEIEKILLNARKTIDGKIIISDHPEMDILVLTNKIISLPKEELDDEVFDSQHRFFNFLIKKGIIDHDSVQAGNLFMSMEANILQADEGDKIQYVLYAISNFIDEELPFYKDQKVFEKEMEDQLLQPEVDEYTEHDPEKYHATRKGSLPPRFARWGINTIYRL